MVEKGIIEIQNKFADCPSTGVDNKTDDSLIRNVMFYFENDTNVYESDNAIKELFNENLHREIQRYYHNKRISRHFDTPNMGTQGGLGMAHSTG